MRYKFFAYILHCVPHPNLKIRKFVISDEIMDCSIKSNQRQIKFTNYTVNIENVLITFVILCLLLYFVYIFDKIHHFVSVFIKYIYIGIESILILPLRIYAVRIMVDYI
jgi:hypothetical protein